MADLQAQFPDMAQSMIGDILSQCEGDQNAARSLLSNLVSESDAQKKKEFELKVAELEQNFSALGRNIIVDQLKAAKEDVEACIVPLLDLLQKHQETSLRKKLEENEKKRYSEAEARREEARRQANSFLKQLFATISEQKILEVLDENDGDVDATTEQLLSVLVVKEQDEKLKDEQRARAEREAAERQLQLERELKVDTLRARFGDNLTDHEVHSALSKNDWDVAKASTQLLQLHEQRAKQQLQRLYLGFTEAQIEAVLNKYNWDVVAASRALASKAEAQSSSPEDAKKNFMMRSALLGKEVLDEVTTQTEKVVKSEDPHEIFKKQLEERIRSEEAGPPGMPVSVPRPQQEAPVIEVKAEQPSTQNSPIPESAVVGVDEGNMSLDLSPEVCGTGESLCVSWKDLAGDKHTVSKNDWIGLYRTEDDDRQYTTYNWIGTPAESGHVSFVAPSRVGSYNVRYFTRVSSGLFSSQYNRRAVSKSIHVGPQFLLSPTVCGSDVILKVSQLSGDECPNAWVGMFASSDPTDHSYLEYKWLSSAQQDVLDFSLPKTGVWHFRLFPHRSYDSVATTSVTVEGEDSLLLVHDMKLNKVLIQCNVASVDPTTDSVWVGLFRVGERDNRQWRRYKYITTRGLSEVAFKAPLHPGTYHARLLANKDYSTVICKSNEITIGHFPVRT